MGGRHKRRARMGQPLRVLVAEDELIVGYDLCDTVAEAGYLVEGPYDDLSSAMLAYQKAKPDIAILDVQLGDGIVYPLAEQMMAEDVPVILKSEKRNRKTYHKKRRKT